MSDHQGYERSREIWWIECHMRELSGEKWTGKLLEQGASVDDGGWVVINDRRKVLDMLKAAGEWLWVVPDDYHGDRLVPASRLEYVMLVEVC